MALACELRWLRKDGVQSSEVDQPSQLGTKSPCRAQWRACCCSALMRSSNFGSLAQHHAITHAAHSTINVATAFGIIDAIAFANIEATLAAIPAAPARAWLRLSAYDLLQFRRPNSYCPFSIRLEED